VLLEISLNLRDFTWCVHGKERGSSRTTGALTVEMVCVWMVASRVTTQTSISDLLPDVLYVQTALLIRLDYASVLCEIAAIIFYFSPYRLKVITI
jgi:hypothetical protein